MRILGTREIELVAGGASFHVGTDYVGFDFDSSEVGEVYDWAVEQMTEFFEWWDPAGYYNVS